MATTITQIQGSISTLISTGLNSLANNALAISSVYNPSGYLFAELELVVTYGVAPNVNSGISIWFLRAPDGTNYEDGGTSVTPVRTSDLIIPVAAITTIQRITRRVSIPSGTFEVLLKNDNTGQSMAASGNTLKILPITYQNA